MRKAGYNGTMSHAMSVAEREAFLADLHVGVLGVTTESGCLAVPIWYDYEPGGEVTIITSPRSVKGRSLESTGRFSLCAQVETLPYRYVTVEGSVAGSEPCPVETVRAMAHRYLGQEIGDAYVEGNTGDGDDSRLYRLTPERWYTVDYGKDLG